MTSSLNDGQVGALANKAALAIESEDAGALGEAIYALMRHDHASVAQGIQAEMGRRSIGDLVIERIGNIQTSLLGSLISTSEARQALDTAVDPHSDDSIMRAFFVCIALQMLDRDTAVDRTDVSAIASSTATSAPTTIAPPVVAASDSPISGDDVTTANSSAPVAQFHPEPVPDLSSLPGAEPAVPSQPNSRRTPLVAGAIVLVVALIGIVLVAANRDDDRADVAQFDPAAVDSDSQSGSSTASTRPRETSTTTPTTTESTTTSTIPVPTSPGSTPEELAQQISDVEHIITDPGESPARVKSAGEMQQLLLRKVDADHALGEQIIPLLDPDISDSVSDYLVIGRATESLVEPQENLPVSWRIVAPRPPEELKGYMQEAEHEFGVPWQYLAAVMTIETRMGRIRGDSSAGAQGPMQFLPSTWDVYGQGDIQDPRDAIFAAARYLRASGAPANMADALFAYNRSGSYVLSVERLAQRIFNDERQYLALHAWQVLYKHVDGVTLLPEGWPDVAERIVGPPD